MKSETLLHYFDPPALALLTGVCIGLTLLLHPLFLLLAFVFVLIWVGEACVASAAKSIHHQQHPGPTKPAT